MQKFQDTTTAHAQLNRESVKRTKYFISCFNSAFRISEMRSMKSDSHAEYLMSFTPVSVSLVRFTRLSLIFIRMDWNVFCFLANTPWVVNDSTLRKQHLQHSKNSHSR